LKTHQFLVLMPCMPTTPLQYITSDQSAKCAARLMQQLNVHT